MTDLKPIEERIPIIVRRLAGSLVLAFIVLGGVWLLYELHISTADRQGHNFGALAIGLAWALVITRLLDYAFFDVAFRLRRKTAAPALLRQLIGLLIFGICVAILFKTLLPDISLGGLFTTSAILTAVIGLALQDTLGNLFAGLALHLEKTVQVGDMIRHGESYGIVEELSWRAIKMRMMEGNIVLVPNSVAGREKLEVFPRPGRAIARVMHVGLEYDASPEKAIQTLQRAAAGVDGVAASPEPVAFLKSFDASAVNYELRYWLEDFGDYLRVDSNVRERAWYALGRAGLPIAYPVIRQHQYAAGKLEATWRHPDIQGVIAETELFAPLSHEQRELLAQNSQERFYAPGEVVVREGENGSSMFVIERGKVAVSIMGAGGESRELSVLEAGSAFGEISLLTGEPRTATVRALTETALVEIEKCSLSPVLHQHPQLTQTLEATMAKRRQYLADQFDASRQAAARAEQPLPLSERIARFFGL